MAQPRRNDISGTWLAWPLVAAFALVCTVYVWTLASTGLDLGFGSEKGDYYNLLVDGFRKGQLSLDAAVSPELLASSDPYDPAKRPAGSALHDASLYRGRYYIYFGVVPAVVLLLPFRAIAGFDLPLPLAVLIICVLTHAVSALLLADVRRRYFPSAGPFVSFVVATAMGFASCAPILIRRGSMYELPIASGAFFALLAIACLYAFVVGDSRGWGWLAAASLNWGLAVGSRPTYVVPALLALLGLVLWLARRERRSGIRPARLWFAAFGPVVCVGLLLAWYNYARFGNPTEFGLRYILSGVYESKIDHFRPRYFAWNAWAYLFAPTEWGRYFPFVHEARIGWPAPHQHYGMDHAFGLLVHVPLFWFGAVALVGATRRDASGFRVLIVTVASTLLLMSALLFCFYAAMARYLGDIAPWAALLGGIGMLTAAAAARDRRMRAIVISCIGAAAAATVFVVFIFSVQLYGRMRAYNPDGHRELARMLNAPVHAFEALFGPPGGALLLDVTFPSALSTRAPEELVRSGFGEALDRVWAEYPDPGHVVLVFEHAGAPEVRTPALALGADRRAEIRISAGFLMPPATWKGYRAWDAGAARRALVHVDIDVDGRRLIERQQRCHDSSPGLLVIGGEGGRAFQGTFRVRREAIGLTGERLSRTAAAAPPIHADSAGNLALRVRFNKAPAGTREPLVVSGETGRGDFVVVEHLGDGRIRLFFDHWGTSPVFGPTLSVEPGRTYRMRLSHPAYASGPALDRSGPRELEVAVDGQVVWTAKVRLHHAEPEEVFVGFNPIGGSSCGERFSGSVEPDRG